MQIKETAKIYDAIIVGSGAGGGMSAYILANAGLKVAIVEAGSYFDPKDPETMTQMKWPWESPRRGASTNRAFGDFDMSWGDWEVDGEPYTVDQIQFVDVQLINLKMVQAQGISSADYTRLLEIAEDKYSSRGAARALYFVLTGTEIASVLPTYSKTTTPRSNESNRLTLYPNPAMSLLNISFGSQAIVSMVMQDVTGKLVYEYSGAASQLVVDVSDMPAGLYVASITRSNGTQEIKKVIIQ